MLRAVKEKAKSGRDLTKRQPGSNRRFGRVQTKVEHVFHVLKCQFGWGMQAERRRSGTGPLLERT